MANGTITMDQLHEDILALRRELEEVKDVVEDIRDEAEVRPEYLAKLKRIESGKFLSREELEKELGE